MTDWTADAPGVRRLIRVEDLPAPYITASADNGPHMVARLDGMLPHVPSGFTVDSAASGIDNPRGLITGPNGDLFISQSQPGLIRIIRMAGGHVVLNRVFASGLTLPFGMAFYPPGPNPTYLYVANTDQVVRIPYRPGDTEARSAPEPVVRELPGGGRLRGGGHWTRDVAFSRDGQKMWVSVGSRTNVDDETGANRAMIHEYRPDGTGFRVYASGIRNAVGIAVDPATGTLWCSVNERDGLGDDVPPDYITHVVDGGFYGWPWYYIGSHQDPRHQGEHPELASHVVVPDVLVQAHYATLQMRFGAGLHFPARFLEGAFAAQHGSWNRARRVGYKVIYVPTQNGKATGEFEDFMTGFVTRDGDVWGRPVGVTVGNDGDLYVTDDGTGTLWRVHYTGAVRTISDTRR